MKESTIKKESTVKTGWIVYLLILIVIAVVCTALAVGINIPPVILYVLPLLIAGITLVLAAIIKAFTNSHSSAHSSEKDEKKVVTGNIPG